MANFDMVADELRGPRPEQTRVVSVVSDASTVEELTGYAESIRGEQSAMLVYFYLHREDVDRHAYHARVESAGDGAWSVDPGDVGERRALYDEFH